MNVLRIIGIALVTVCIQWLLIQDLPLTEFGNPYIYLWAFFIIPYRTSKATHLYYCLCGRFYFG